MIMHYMGALMVFVFGTLYQIMDALLTFRMRYSRALAVTRIVLATVSVAALCTGILYYSVMDSLIKTTFYI